MDPASGDTSFTSKHPERSSSSSASPLHGASGERFVRRRQPEKFSVCRRGHLPAPSAESVSTPANRDSGKAISEMKVVRQFAKKAISRRQSEVTGGVVAASYVRHGWRILGINARLTHTTTALEDWRLQHTDAVRYVVL